MQEMFDIFMLQALAGSCAEHDSTEGNICKGKTSDGQFECTSFLQSNLRTINDI
jgi:hypothetical protein